jgi:putative DNA primase/helicase
VKPNGQDTNFDSPQPFLAELAGVRLVSMSEADESEMLSSAAVKTMTGRDDVTTRALYGRPFTYTPQFTMWLSTNYLPLVDDNTIFMSKRIWVIPFEECFAGKPDTGLKDLLTAPETRPTVLSWLLEGCQEYLKQGLNPPQSIIVATERYNSGNDLIGRFLSACTEPNRSEEISCGRLYDVYRAWCSKSENRFRPWATRRFYRALEMHGYVLRMENGGSQVVEGLKLKV